MSRGKDLFLDLQFGAWYTSYSKDRTDNLRLHNVFLALAEFFRTLKGYLGPSTKTILRDPVCELSLI